MIVEEKESTICGIPTSHGIAIGKLVFFTHDEGSVNEINVSDEQVKNEVIRYERAVKRTKQDIKRLKKQLEIDRSLEAAAILETQLQILDDPLLTSEIKENIVQSKKNAEFVFHRFLQQYQKKFNEIKDPFFRERGCDLLDISRRILGYLKESGRVSIASLPMGSIVFSHEIAASDVAEAHPQNICAIISDTGGATSHAAIVAKAKGIPYIVNVSFSSIEVAVNSEIIVDGSTGEIILHPLGKTLTQYKKAKKQLDSLYNELEKTCSLKSETWDGFEVKLSANIEMVSEIDALHQYGGCGVGLFRSEYIFLSKQSIPSEEAQYLIYSQIISAMKGLPIVIRTFDLGGDKQQAWQKASPYLGSRAIRFLLKEKDLFKAQIRAILRASERGAASIMFPMIADLSELTEAKELIAEVQNELSLSRKITEKKVRIGCMIEVPSAAVISDLLAKECDFLAIGTNDLIQYLFAVDRSNQAVGEHYNSMHPALIRMIKLIVTQASQYGTPVCVCGEIAGDPRFTPLLIGLGVHELSVSIRNLPLIKKVVRQTSVVRAHQLAEQVLELASSSEIQELLNAEFRSIMPDDYHYVNLYC